MRFRIPKEQTFNRIGTFFGAMTILALVLILAQEISQMNFMRSSLDAGFFSLFWGGHVITRYFGKGQIIIMPSIPIPPGEKDSGLRIFGLLMGLFMLYVAFIVIFVLNEN